MAFYLADMRGRGLHQELGYATLERFSAACLGLAPSSVRDRIAVARTLEAPPAIDHAFAERRLGWSVLSFRTRVATSKGDADVMLEAAKPLLSTRPDGTV